MDKQEVQKAKWINYVAFAMVLLMISWAGFGVYRYATRPLAEWLTVDGLRSNVEQAPRVDGRLNGQRFEQVCTEEFLGLFRWDQWEKTASSPSGEPVLAIYLADEYDIEFYENGLVYAFDGYASSDVVGEVYYWIPEEVLADLVDYLG